MVVLLSKAMFNGLVGLLAASSSGLLDEGLALLALIDREYSVPGANTISRSLTLTSADG